MQWQEGKEQWRRREDQETLNILKELSSEEVLRHLTLSHFLLWGWPRSMRKRHKNRQFIKKTQNRPSCTSTVRQGEHGERLSCSSRQHISTVKTWNTSKNNSAADWCLQLALERDTRPRPQSKLTSPKAAKRISQLFPHEQRSLYPRSNANNCTAGQVSGYYTQSPCLGCSFWTLTWFYLCTASTWKLCC